MFWLIVVTILGLLAYKFRPKNPNVIHRKTGKQLDFGSRLDTWYFLFGIKNTLFEDDNLVPDRDIFGAHFMGDTYVYVNDPNELKKFINNTTYVKDINITKEMDRIYRKGLLFVSDKEDDPVWSRQKKILRPSFKKSEIITNIQPIFKDVSDLFIRTIRKVDHEPVEIESWLERFTFDVIGKAGFSYDYGAIEDETNRIFLDAKRSFGSLLIADAAHMKIPFSKRGQEMKKSMDNTVEMMKGIIKERRMNPREVPMDILDNILLMENEEVMNNVFLFFLAGSETTVSVITSVIYFASIYPDIQDEIHREIDKYMASHEDVTEINGHFKYLMNVLNESMRLRTPIKAFGSRVTNEDLVICDYNVPAGTKLSCWIPKLHLNKEFWGEDVKEFKPDRWNDSKHGSYFMPFSAGRRECIGKYFAINEMITFLAIFFRNYSVRLVEGFVMKDKPLSIARRAINGMPIILSRR